MSSELEYAIKKDIRNNPVVREVDSRQKREFRRMVVLFLLAAGMFLFAAYQRFVMLRHGVKIEELRADLAYETEINRKLRLNRESLLAPQLIERRALALGLREASPAETLVIERVRSSLPAGTVVAQAH